MFTVSINPTYKCNFRCPFCYLTEKQLADKKKMDLYKLSIRLSEISLHREITHVDLYGGEVTVLPDKYVDEMLRIIRNHFDGKINVVTNLSRPLNRTQWLLQDDIEVSVSWDYTCREGWDTVMKNISLLGKDVHVLMLASKCMVEWTDDELGAAQMILNSLRNVRSVEIKPYSTNQANQDEVPFTQFEDLVKRWIEMRQFLDGMNDYEFVNEKLMMEAVTGARNAYSDDHIYITPEGKFAVLEFDENDNEYFYPVDSFEMYELWARQEKDKVEKNEICGECKYLGHCLSEHLRDVKDIKNSCNGFRKLLEWYEARVQIKTGDV